MLHKSKFITRGLLEEIFQEIKDEWTKKFITDVPNRVAAMILVLDPAQTAENSHEPVELWSGILGDQNPANWKHNYHDFAFAKARAAWRTKMDNDDMFEYPELIQEGDFKYHGGIYRNGLVIAISGLQTADQDVDRANEFYNLVSKKLIQLFKDTTADKTELSF